MRKYSHKLVTHAHTKPKSAQIQKRKNVSQNTPEGGTGGFFGVVVGVELVRDDVCN